MNWFRRKVSIKENTVETFLIAGLGNPGHEYADTGIMRVLWLLTDLRNQREFGCPVCNLMPFLAQKSSMAAK